MMKEAAQRLEEITVRGCINCHAPFVPFSDTSYGFGPSTPPGAERREVGPFCYACVRLIHQHLGVKIT